MKRTSPRSWAKDLVQLLKTGSIIVVVNARGLRIGANSTLAVVAAVVIVYLLTH